jgi:hypothetical protein
MAALALIAAGLACNFSAPAKAPDPTLTALSASVAGTATAAAEDEGGSGEDLATARAEATQRSLEIEATRTVSASGRDEAQLATATVAAPVLAELPRYGLDPAAGRLGWLHPPATIEIEGYHQFGFANEFQGVVARDFAMAADITWDTQYGASGCGFMFRSNGDQNKPDQYMVIITRLGNGHVVFNALAAGEVANVRDYYPGTDDQSFRAENGTTNRIAVVGRGYLFEIYSNGVKIGEVDATQPPVTPVLPKAPQPPQDQTNLEAVKKYQDKLKEYTDMVDQVQTNYQVALQNYKKTQALFEEGFVGMIALSESGRTSCKFENAWLWLVE